MFVMQEMLYAWRERGRNMQCAGGRLDPSQYRKVDSPDEIATLLCMYVSFECSACGKCLETKDAGN